MIAALWARSKEDIQTQLATVQVLDPSPDWLTDERKELISSVYQYDIDSGLDLKTLTEPPDLVFDRDNPPPWRQG